MKTTQTLAICDLNAAVAACDSLDPLNSFRSCNCILAQFGKRVLGRSSVASGYTEIWPSDDCGTNLMVVENRVASIVHLFDGKHFAEIRRQLPMEVEVEIL